MPQYEIGENNNNQTVILPPALFCNLGERKREVLKVKRSSEKAKLPTKGSKDAVWTLGWLNIVQTSYRLNTEFAISCDTRQEELTSPRGLKRSHPMSS
jgi:hypothetical protein